MNKRKVDIDFHLDTRMVWDGESIRSVLIFVL